MKKYVLLLGCISLLSVLSACGIGWKEQEAYQEKIAARFRELGYKGEVEVEDTWYAIESGDQLRFTYREEVEGRQLAFSNILDLDTEAMTFENDRLVNWFSRDEFEADIDWMIQTQAMWQQEFVDQQFQQMTGIFQTMEDKDLQLGEISGQLLLVKRVGDTDLVWQDVLEGQATLYQDFKDNQAQGLPVNGYYTIDVPAYLKKGILEIHIDFDWHLSDEEGEAATRLAFFEKVEALDYQNFWDGYYVVGFSRHTASNRTASIKDGLVLHIQNGEVVRSFPAG